jgi:hypothetical protein
LPTRAISPDASGVESWQLKTPTNAIRLIPDMLGEGQFITDFGAVNDRYWDVPSPVARLD